MHTDELNDMFICFRLGANTIIDGSADEHALANLAVPVGLVVELSSPLDMRIRRLAHEVAVILNHYQGATSKAQTESLLELLDMFEPWLLRQQSSRVIAAFQRLTKGVFQ